MKNKDILKKYVCLNPFRYTDIQPASQWVCCPSWCPKDIRDTEHAFSPITFEENFKNNWHSKSANEIRRSVTDGSYEFCNHIVCPSLSKLINTGELSNNFVTVEEFNKMYDVDNYDQFPEEILFGFDRSCNLKCPSCRSDLVPNDDVDSEEHKIKEYIIESIEKHYSKSAKFILITGSGDPIYSKIYREYLQNFDASKYPNLEKIQLITNGNLLNEKMWNSFKAKPYIKSIDISVDAGTKETYENITRLNGDWEKLIENLKFLSTIDTIETFICSMVVSIHNYKEMKQFYDLILNIFEKSNKHLTVLFTQHVYWGAGAYSISDMSKLSVFEPEHPEFNDFLKEFKKINNLPRVKHNFHHLTDRL